MAIDINKEDPHYKGEYGSIYEVNRNFPTGGVTGDFVVIEGWAHYWNAQRGTWCVNAKRDSYWDELITSLIEKFKLIRGATYMGVANLDTVPTKVIGAKMYYFATVAGTYKNFDNLVVPQGINVLYSENGSSWVNTTLLEVAQELGVSTNKVVSQKTLNDALAKKFDKESVVQESGEAEDKVMSQKAVSDKLRDLYEEINNSSDKVLSKNINVSGNLPINYNTGNGTAGQLIVGNVASVSLAKDTDSPFCEYFNYGLKCENSNEYFATILPELRDSIISGNTNSICISFWLDYRGIKENNSYVTFTVGEAFIVNKLLSDIDGLNGSYDGDKISYNYSVTYKKQLRGYKNISLVLTNVVNKAFTNSSLFKVSCTAILPINTFVTNLTIISSNSIDEYLIYPDKNGALYYNLDVIKKDIAKNTLDTAKNTSDIETIKSNNIEVTDYNLNKNVGTENETIILSNNELSAVEDTDSPFSGILGKCTEGLSRPSIDLMPYIQNDFNTLVFALWVNIDAIVATSTGLYLSIVASLRHPAYTTLEFGTGQKKFNSLSVGSIFKSTIDNNAMSATTTFEYVDKKGSWHKLVGKLTNIVWKINKSSLTKFNVYFNYNFVSSGVFRFQNTTCLLGNDIEYKYIPYNLIYPDGINQVQYPYNAQAATTLALKNKNEIKDIRLLMAGKKDSPLYGKYIAWVADSLLEGCANIVDGVAVPQNYNTIDEIDRDEQACGITAYVANGSNISKNVNWPYWIAKRTHCINHLLGASGQTIFGWAADNPLEYFYWYYKVIGRVVGFKSAYDQHNIEYIGNDGTYALRSTYTPDYIILSFGTNDNMSLVDVDSLPTLDSLPSEGGEEYKNKTFKLTTDDTYWSWKDDGTGGEGVPHYSWVQIFPKTVGSYETAWDGHGWNTNTLWGCYAKVITYYRQKWPDVKIGIILDGNTSRVQRNAFIRICRTFGIGFLDLHTLSYPVMYNNIRGYSINGEPYKQENNFPKGCIVHKDGHDYVSLCDIPANSVWDESKWGYSIDNKMTTKSPVALGQADRDNMPSITGRSEGNYSKGENIFIWGDYLAMLYSYDQFVHPTLRNAKVKSQIVENWLLTL